MEITVMNPDDQHDMPLYEGEHADAFNHIRPGQYTATDEDDAIWQLLVTNSASDLALNLTGHGHPIVADFEPLLRALPGQAHLFSFMGAANADGQFGEPIEILRFKHKHTERYLSLTADLLAFEVRFHPTEAGDGVAVLLDLDAAKKGVFVPSGTS